MKTVVRPYRPGDEEAINAAFNQVFGLSRPLAEWHWKFPEKPEGRWILSTFDEERQALAQYAAVPVCFQAYGHTVRAGHIVDVFSVRRQGLARMGLFPSLVERFFAEYGGPDRLALLFGFPGTRHLRLGLVQMGYGTPRPVDYWTRAAIAPRWRLRPYRVLPGFAAPAVDRLWANAAGRYPVAAVRDSGWLARRFTGRPGVDYVHLGAVPLGRRTPEAWGVVRITESAVRWAELIWDGRHPAALAALDRAIVRLAREAGRLRLELWMGGDREAGAVLEDCGWERREQPDQLHLTVRSFDPRFTADRLTENFYFTLGDSDLT